MIGWTVVILLVVSDYLGSWGILHSRTQELTTRLCHPIVFVSYDVIMVVEFVLVSVEHTISAQAIKPLFST